MANEVNATINVKDDSGKVTAVYPVTKSENVIGFSELSAAVSSNSSAVSALAGTVEGKVDKVSGKGLSTNDYTTTEKNKLAGIAANANNYTLPAATASLLGGVKTGSNITNSSGTISITKANVTSALGYTPPQTMPDVPEWALQVAKPTYTKAEIGLANANNTADIDKPVSRATLEALNGKASVDTVASALNRIAAAEAAQSALTSRMDTFTNLSNGSTTGDAELVDVRTGYNGILYGNAGSSVREQVLSIKRNADYHTNTAVSEIYDGYHYLERPDVVQGVINHTTGSYSKGTDAKLCCTSNFIPVEIGKTYSFSTAGQLAFNVYYYDANQKYLGSKYTNAGLVATSFSLLNAEYSYVKIGCYAKTDVQGLYYAYFKMYTSSDKETITSLKSEITKSKNATIQANSNVTIDTAAKTVEFGNSTFVFCGNTQVDISNTTHSVAEFTSGQFVYFDPISATLTTTKANNWFIGAYWADATKIDWNIRADKIIVNGASVLDYSVNPFKNGYIHTKGNVYFDTTEKTVTFEANTFVKCGSKEVNISNTTHSIADFTAGMLVYFDPVGKRFTGTKNVNYWYIGAYWNDANRVDWNIRPDKIYVNGTNLYSAYYSNTSKNAVFDVFVGVNIDTANKTITFGALSYISCGNTRKTLPTDPIDISAFASGQFVYFEPGTMTFTTAKSSTTWYVGAFWANYYGLDWDIDKSKVTVDGMPICCSSRFVGKTVNCLGDSMTYGSGTTKAYHQWFKQLINCKTVNNYGVAGSCISPKKEAHPSWEEGIGSFLERYSDMGEADVITVFGGVNDWVTGKVLGTINDTTDDTFYGSMKLLCAGLIAKYPTGRIYFFFSPQTDYIHRPANFNADSPWKGNTDGKSKRGNTLTEFSNAMKEVCAMYGIPFKDLYSNSWYGLSGVLGNNAGTSGVYGSDCLHPNADGHKILAIKMASFINEN